LVLVSALCALAIFARAHTALADTAPIQVQPGQTVAVPLSANARVLVTCGAPPYAGPSGGTAQVLPSGLATIGGFDPSKVIVPPGSPPPPSIPATQLVTTLSLSVSPTAPVGTVIAFSWTSFADGCYSANGGAFFVVVAGSPPPLPPGGGTTSKVCQIAANANAQRLAADSQAGIWSGQAAYFDRQAEQALDDARWEAVGAADPTPITDVFSTLIKGLDAKTVIGRAPDLVDELLHSSAGRRFVFDWAGPSPVGVRGIERALKDRSATYAKFLAGGELVKKGSAKILRGAGALSSFVYLGNYIAYKQLAAAARKTASDWLAVADKWNAVDQQALAQAGGCARTSADTTPSAIDISARRRSLVAAQTSAAASPASFGRARFAEASA
jgi:hypothetical protein